MTVFFEAPGIEEVRRTLRGSLPELAERRIAPLGEGWDFVTFTAGDKVVRVPKVDRVWTLAGDVPLGQRLRAESAMLHELAPSLPLPVPVPTVFDDGPNGLPFTVYDFISGVALGRVGRPAGPGFVKTYASFIQAMRSYPVSRLREHGLPVFDGATTRSLRIQWYEMLVRRTFPLISCEARTYVAERVETYLNEPRNFDFEPVLSHCDLDLRNTLADPGTGEIAGVVDFGDACACDPAMDLTWALMGGFEAVGIADHLPAFFEAMGTTPEAVRARCEFYKFCWPMYEIIHGLDRGDPEEVSDGIRFLNDSLPANIRCPD